jgi:cytoplasmic iron level regulating protein YaaA (DUF328/UPF0246 family)
MRLILPPSETKRDGGLEGSALALTSLSFAGLTAQRTEAIAALTRLSRNVAASTAALGLGPTQRFEIERNRAIRTASTMPAIDRYTGVLFEGLASESLDAEAHAWLGRHVVVHSALFGLVGAADAIPAYRLSHDSRIPGLTLRRHWSHAISLELAAVDGLLLDLRSESYAHLGPRPEGSFYLRVVTDGPNGQKRALNHFNKKGKGEFVRELALAGIDHTDVASLLEWAASRGIRLAHGKPGELELTV